MKNLNILYTILQSGTLDLPPEANLRPIFIPTFVDFSGIFDTIGGPAATVFSTLAFIGSLATILIAVFWVYRIVRIGIEGIQSQGKPEKIQEIIKSLQNVFLGVFMSFLFPLILSVIGVLAGVGTIFEWPRMFRSCETSTEFGYYFQAFLAAEGATAQADADRECGYQ